MCSVLYTLTLSYYHFFLIKKNQIWALNSMNMTLIVLLINLQYQTHSKNWKSRHSIDVIMLASFFNSEI